MVKQRGGKLTQLLIVLLTLGLVACGGDGGSSSTSPPAPSGLSYPAPPLFTVNTAITPLIPTVTGSVVSYSIAPALPTGLTLDTTTGVISGTPTAPQAATNYQVIASNTGGISSATLSIRVNDLAPAITYPRASYTFATGAPVSGVTPAVTGGTVTGWSVSPTLPAGLAVDATSGEITGTPVQVTANANYTVTAQNSGGIDTFDLDIGVQSGVLLDTGHIGGIVAIKQTATRILSLDAIGVTLLLNAQTGERLLRAFDSDRLEMLNDAIAIVHTAQGTVVYYSAVDGTLLSQVQVGRFDWGVASDGSYVWGSDNSNFRVWSPSGQLLLTRSDAYRGKILALPGKLLVAGGPVAPSGVETITIPGGVSSVAPATFNGVFSRWFSDGSNFLTTAGNSIWVYSPDVAQQDFLQPPTQAGLDGRGNRFWTFTNNTLNIYAVGASSTPLASFVFGGTTPGRIIASANTLTFLNDTNSLSIVDLAPATPTRTDYSSLTIVAGAIGLATSTDWSIGDERGVMVSEPSSGGSNPMRYSIGPIKGLAAGATHVALVTSLGTLRIYDMKTRALVTEVNVSPAQLQMSADGTVLAMFIESSPYSLHGTLEFHALPSMSLLTSIDLVNTGLALQQFKLSDSGQMLSLATLGGGGADEYARSVVRLDGTVTWSDTVTWSSQSLSRTPFPLPQVSPDGTTIAIPPAAFSTALGSDIYRNGTLLTTLVGYASGWLANDRVLMTQYSYDVHGMAWWASGCQIVDLGRAPVTCGQGSYTSLGQVASDSSGYEVNSIRDFFTGATTWQSPAPLIVTYPKALGSLAGNSVVFQSYTEIRIEPR